MGLLHGIQIPFIAQILLFVAFYFTFKIATIAAEWIRVHYIVNTRLPRGPPVTNFIVGNLLDVTRKDFHRTHQEYADLFGGIYPYRALWFHVSIRLSLCMSMASTSASFHANFLFLRCCNCTCNTIRQCIDWHSRLCPSPIHTSLQRCSSPRILIRRRSPTVSWIRYGLRCKGQVVLDPELCSVLRCCTVQRP